jgi:trimeric autotransporter adhesin
MKYFYAIISFFIVSSVLGQVGIGNVSPKAQLDISASNITSPIATDGLLIPRVTAFPSPVTAAQNGMLVFLTTAFSTNQVGFYFYDFPSLTWKWLFVGSSNNSWTTIGNATTVDGTNFIGTTDAIPFNIRVNNQKSGRISSTGETFFGFEAGKNNTNSANDRNNSAFGYRAFTSNATTTARDNTAIGQTSLTANNGGSYNTGIGSATLESNIIGNDNTAVGKFALKSNTGSFNTAIGSEALVVNTTGVNNVAIGYKTLKTNIIGNDNTAIGYQALFTNTAPSNTAIGSSSLTNNTIGTFNTAAGVSSLNKNTTGDYNVAIGNNASFFNTSGSSNTAVGYSALFTNTVGINNTAVGRNALNFNTASNNVAFGHTASYKNTTGTGNVALGFQTLYENLTGSNNTAVGLNALQTGTGNNNTAIGSNVLALSTLGSQNTAVGENSLSKATVGSTNEAFGHRALWNLTSGNFNSGFGYVTLGLVTTGSFNTALGSAAGSNISTGSGNITIGRSSQVPIDTGNDQLSIGNVIYGSAMSTTASGKIGIGVTNPGTRFQVGPDHIVPNIGGLVQVNLNDADAQIQGLKVSVKKTTGDNFAVNGTAFGTGATTNYGLYGYAANATGKNWGLYVDEGDGYIKGSVGIGTFTPNVSAALDITSTTKGLLLPRMTKTQRNLIITPTAGLMIFQIDATPGLRVYNGTNWIRYTETID